LFASPLRDIVRATTLLATIASACAFTAVVDDLYISSCIRCQARTQVNLLRSQYRIGVSVLATFRRDCELLLTASESDESHGNGQ
ncbi:hypothetical protein, partial [Corynebacterium sp. UMB10321]|uniref:hypothetical protein n=1 Tax=Corynebacterium sp. UMB10321 TaxID=3046312 RepID=UPI00254B7479